METNTVKNCCYFGFGGYFLVAGTGFLFFVFDFIIRILEQLE